MNDIPPQDAPQQDTTPTTTENPDPAGDEFRQAPPAPPHQPGRRTPLFETPKAPPQWFTGLLYAWAGIVAPTICLYAFAVEESMMFDWQSGWNAAAGLILGSSGWPFYPFVLYAMLSLALVLLRGRGNDVDELPIRLGIWVGIVMAYTYSIILSISFFAEGDSILKLTAIILVSATGSLILSGLVAALLTLIGRSLISLTGRIVAVIIAVVIWWLSALAYGTAATPLMLAILLLLTSPFWTLVAFILIAKRIGLLVDFFPAPIGGSILAKCCLGGAYLGALLWSIRNSSAAYPELPPSQPGCYIATAAANGHVAVVRSEPVLFPDGRVLWVNRQLRVLKAAELRIAARTPRLHRAMRAVYDTLGPPMAGMLASPYLADAAWLALKPFEWLAALCLCRPRPRR